MDKIINDLIREIPAIENYKHRPLISILKYIDIVSNGNKGFIELSDSEELSQKLLKKGFYNEKIDNLLTALKLINSSFNKSGNDAFTNLDLADSIVDEYEIIYGWHPKNKFLFPCNRYGNFSLKVIIKLMNSSIMKEFIEDDYNRFKYILENQIYIVDEKSVNNFIYLLLTDIGSEFKNNIFTGEFLYDKFVKHAQNEWGINCGNRFTAVFCEPNYIEFNARKKNIRSSTNVYVYQKYALKSVYFSDVVACLMPANWMKTNSNKLQNLSEFRIRIKISNHIRKINYYDIDNNYVNKNKFLMNCGGLSYIIYDSSYTGYCNVNNIMVNLSKIDIIPTNDENLELIYFVKDYCNNNGSLKIIYDGSSGCLKSDDNRLHYEMDIKNNTKVITSIYSTNFYGNINNGAMFCDSENLGYFEKKNLKKWKVLLPETCTSAGKGLSSNMIISKPGELYTNTFGVFIVKTEESANSLVSYLKTDFVNTIISEIKIKNHINKHILEYIPNIPLDRIWSSQSILEYLNISKDILKTK